ncbi:MAG: SMP-30/gluconolactonase/LRE family protein [Gemmatimonadetes bacterium]|nr:SMP-30/gluconolactonase/LRE family protein [Gemmatimonadota bacterium]
MRPRLGVVAVAVFAGACSTAEAPTPAGAPAPAEAPINIEAFTVVNEAAFRQLLPADGAVTKLAGDLQFVEGPVWIDREEGYLVFSDIPANELKRWDPVGGVQTFRAPSGMANGNTLDLQNRLVTAQHDGRITRTAEDGTVTTVVDAYMGRRLSSPNDVVVKSDGSLWFTDPPYGLGDRKQETPGNYVYRLGPDGSTLTAVVTDMDRPNGLCFSPDEATLYVADSGMQTRHIRSFAVGADGSVSGGDVFATLDRGAPDGIRCDELGHVWSSSGDGAQIFSAAGELVARILLPEAAANLAFGGPDGRTVYFTARTSLYSVPALVRDARNR